MDITDHPEFAETYAGIKRSFGAEWAARFVLAAPVMVGDPSSPVYRAFLRGLEAHSAGAPAVEDEAWATCLVLLDQLAGSLVDEAEALLASR